MPEDLMDPLSSEGHLFLLSVFVDVFPFSGHFEANAFDFWLITTTSAMLCLIKKSYFLVKHGFYIGINFKKADQKVFGIDRKVVDYSMQFRFFLCIPTKHNKLLSALKKLFQEAVSGWVSKTSFFLMFGK